MHAFTLKNRAKIKFFTYKSKHYVSKKPFTMEGPHDYLTTSENRCVGVGRPG